MGSVGDAEQGDAVEEGGEGALGGEVRGWVCQYVFCGCGVRCGGD